VYNQTKRLVRVLGITGGIGSGKSTVCSVFSVLGIPSFNSDTVSKSILFSKEVSQKVVDLFGNDVTSNGCLDSVKLGVLVFSNQKKLILLNQILHPKVDEAFVTWKEKQSAPFVVKEAAILFESGSYKNCDWVLHISCSESKRIKRVKRRDKRDVAQIKEIIKNQWSDKKKESLSNFVIENDNKKIIPQIYTVRNSLLSHI
jgi:dephospho-CoA kinase